MKTLRQIVTRVALLATLMAVSGCGGGSSDSVSPPDPPPPPTNNAPTISGDPLPEVQVGEDYSFTPQASDPDGDPLTFSIENMPSWADFDSGTGQLSGTPTLAHVGQYENIMIAVSDGLASAMMPGFTIDVTQVGPSSITLSWTAPTQNEDGSTLTDLAGFIVYYGTSPGVYSSEIRIDNPSVTTYVVENLSPGTYYLAATAFNDAAVESRFSGEAVRTLN